MNRIKKLTMGVIFTAFVATCTPGCAPAYVQVSPPPVKVEVKAPRPGQNYVWIPGHWKYTSHGYVWVSGHWKKRHHNSHWIAGHWQHTPSGWVWVPGHWSK